MVWLSLRSSGQLYHLCQPINTRGRVLDESGGGACNWDPHNELKLESQYIYSSLGEISLQGCQSACLEEATLCTAISYDSNTAEFVATASFFQQEQRETSCRCWLGNAENPAASLTSVGASSTLGSFVHVGCQAICVSNANAIDCRLYDSTQAVAFTDNNMMHALCYDVCSGQGAAFMGAKSFALLSCSLELADVRLTLRDSQCGLLLRLIDRGAGYDVGRPGNLRQPMFRRQRRRPLRSLRRSLRGQLHERLGHRRLLGYQKDRHFISSTTTSFTLAGGESGGDPGTSSCVNANTSTAGSSFRPCSENLYFSGPSTTIVDCTTLTCENDGICVDFDGGPNCECPTTFVSSSMGTTLTISASFQSHRRELRDGILGLVAATSADLLHDVRIGDRLQVVLHHSIKPFITAPTHREF